MAKLLGHIGAPHGAPYRYSDIRCERRGFLNIFTYAVDTMSYRLEMMDRGHASVILPVDYTNNEIVLIIQPRFNIGFVEVPGARHLLERARREVGLRGILMRFLRGIKHVFNDKHEGGGDVVMVPADVALCRESPAGMVDPGETAAQAAIRELFEETGYLIDASRLSQVAEYHPSLGGCTEQITAFIADVSGLEPDLTHVGDHAESISVWKVGFEEAFAMLASGEIRSASSHIMFRELQLQMLRGGYQLP